jgi:hypothetical protein
VRFSIQELSNLQTEIQVFVEELNSMKVCHWFRVFSSIWAYVCSR